MITEGLLAGDGKSGWELLTNVAKTLVTLGTSGKLFLDPYVNTLSVERREYRMVDRHSPAHVAASNLVDQCECRFLLKSWNPSHITVTRSAILKHG